MKLIFIKILFVVALLLSTSSSSSVFSQGQFPLNIALVEVNENYEEWNLTKSDVTDMFVSDLVIDKKTGISRVYFQQRYVGIKANAAFINVSIDANGNVFFVAKQFIPELSSKINSVIPVLSGEEALHLVLAHLEITPERPLKIKKQDGTREFVFDGAEFASSNIQVELQFQSMEDNKTVRLAWDIIINPQKNSDFWTMRIDAITGEIIAKYNLTVYCSHHKGAYHNHDAHCREKPQGLDSVEQALTTQSEAISMLAEDGSMYNIFALPVESPAHGDRAIVENPAWLTASPFGWHDTNGVDGPEYTITRGNNVWSYQDRDGNGTSNGDEPDGGSDLIFDFPYDEDNEPDSYVKAATTNLFYMANAMHDFAYAYGMDESGGAFQTNNYGNGGTEGDPVIALAQQGADAGAINNASFSPTVDGESGVMSMYVWDQTSSARYLQVDAPLNITGIYQTGITEGWGATIGSNNPVSGIVVEANDNVFNATATDACEELVNGLDVMGNIALVDRGSCDFSTKALNAQNSGAIAVIVCDYDDSVNNMAPGAVGSQVTIPVVRIKSSDCAILRQNTEDGLEVTLVAPPIVSPGQLDGDLDNGIIAHEYAHGISGRLTCGPSEPSLQNLEQMGEGWSDFMSLVVTAKEGDTGDMRRGLATYVERQEIDGSGVRRYPYSTDMSINPLTYRNVAGNTRIHALGEVWCSMLWDLYWAFVDQDGWDADIYEGTGGNNMAIRLVFEGMKNQACNPGFIDGRDAILAADVALNGGANQCLIWETFARRGAGYYASQGSHLSAADQIEDFEPLPICVQELKINKAVSPLVNAGDNIDVTLTIINHKPESLTGITVTDEIPTGTSYVAGSGSISGTVAGNTVSFELGTMNYEDEIVITYQISTSIDEFSIQKFYEDVEGPIPNWNFDTFFPDDVTNNWQQSNNNSNSGEKSFYANNIGVASVDAVVLTSPITITGDNPVLRFYHNYNTQSGADAGIFEVTTGNPVELSTLWLNAGDNFFRGEYASQVEYLTFSIPNLEAFSGNSDGWIATYVDMSDYIGEEVYIRYRFGTNNGTAAVGWFVDDIEFMDMINYNAEACVTSAEGDNACDTPEGRGTVIESQVITSTFEPVGENLAISVYPNPANDLVHIRMNTAEATDVKITLYSVDGRLLQSQDVNAIGEMDVQMNVSTIAEGFYFLHVNADGNVYTEKLVIN
ncbi:MAG: extracellular elastinolytic metalloproteinase [Saprospiraceae bacterium]|jgi:extracellular elastinolytic metalloproteinase